MENQIKALIAQALEETYQLEKSVESIQLEKPADAGHGDWATNVALVLAKELKQNPRQIAESIVEVLKGAETQNEIEKIEVAGPGFINFYATEAYYLRQLNARVKTTANNFAGKKVIVEFTDPNPFKELHIGHLYSNTVGESIARIFEAAGAEVKRADYFGDVGMHVAKSLWGLIRKMKEDSLSMEELSGRSLQKRIKYLGQAYARGATAFKESDAAKEEMKGINKQVFVVAQRFYNERYGKDPIVDYTVVEAESPCADEQIAELYLAGREWSLAYFDSIYDRVGMGYDFYFPESVVAEEGYALVKEGLQKGIFTESDGAVVLDKEKSGLHTRVFINSMGLPTYEAKELGLAPAKYKDFEYDLSVIITADEIDEYFKVLLKAMEMLLPDLRAKTEHRSHGMVRLPEGKMSSRTGKIVRAEDVLDEVKRIILESNTDVELEDERAEKIAQAALKYAFLRSKVEGNIEFDMQTSVAVDGDTGPYLQYTYVRAKAILEKLHVEQIGRDIPEEISLDESETELLKSLVSYSEKLASAAESRQPYIVASAIYEIARSFNSFYGNHNVKAAEGERQKLWLLLTAEVAKVIEAGLHVLGIEVVEEM